MTGERDAFEVYRDKAGLWRWRRKASNGAVVGAATQGYRARADCEANMNRGPVPSDTWEFYADARGEHRWRRTASNGNVVGASSEGYKARVDAQANAARFGWSA